MLLNLLIAAAFLFTTIVLAVNFNRFYSHAVQMVRILSRFLSRAKSLTGALAEAYLQHQKLSGNLS